MLNMPASGLALISAKKSWFCKAFLEILKRKPSIIAIRQGNFKVFKRMQYRKNRKPIFNVLALCVISIILLGGSGCSWVDRMTEREEMLSDEGVAELDEKMLQDGWSVPEGPSQALRPRTWNLQHQKLWVRFDFDQEKVLGTTELFLTNMQSANDELILDAKTMEFEHIGMIDPDQELEFEQDSAIVTISLPESYSRDDSIYIEIDYVAEPPERGLYFVDPRGEDPSKPTQVWTLGQPEDNSFWFPTIDNPAERMTQEVWLSVPDSLETLSNGSLIESRTEAGDSLRTDNWKLDEPHAPYLLALAVGNYHIDERPHDGITMRYYTEHFYSKYVDLIYAHTEEMFDYIHDHLDFRYPWGAVYSQVPVHDYIAGGMENTTATILHDGVQFDTRADQDRSNQGLIMHEIIHHWFGNLVTAKNWANLPLNEGFANYFEILFREHLQGEDEAAWKNLNYRETYFNEAQDIRRPLIWDQYTEPEDMYDRHTYQKAGQILRMLHEYIGDETWWAALNAYLHEFEHQAVDADDLQQLFERETGESLDWFFDPWFHEPGHPTLQVYWDSTAADPGLRVQQVQSREKQPLFRVEADVEIHSESGIETKNIRVDQQDSLYVFDQEEITDVIFDPERLQLAEYQELVDEDRALERLDHPKVAVRAETIGHFYRLEWNERIEEQIKKLARDDDFWGIRKLATELLRNRSSADLTDFALDMTYENEEAGEVRVEAFYLLEGNDSDKVESFARSMTRDTSYYVAAEAIQFYGRHFPDNVHEVAPEFIEKYSYQNLFRTAAVNALNYSTHPDAYQALKKAAGHHGNREYTKSALSFLPQFTEEMEVTDELADFFVDKAKGSPYAEIRVYCYEGLAEINATGKLDFLREQLEKPIDQQERQVLENVIEMLEESV